MGVYASVIVFPQAEIRPSGIRRWLPRRAAAKPEHAHLLQEARDIVDVFVRRGFVSPGVADCLNHAAHTTSVTSSTFEGPLNTELPADLAWAHLYIEAHHVDPSIERIIWTQTYEDWNADLPMSPDQDPYVLAAPEIDIMTFSRDIEVVDGYSEKVVCRARKFIEFSFGDYRFDEEVHRIRDMSDPFFADLATVLGCPPAWTRCLG